MQGDYFDELELEGDEQESGDPLEEDATDFDDERDTAPDDASPEHGFAAVGPVIRVAVDWVELEGALENNSPELHSFFNKVTGDVIRIFRGSEDAEERLREVESDPDYIYIEPISSREQYRWMEEFIETVEESNLKDKLNIAIDGKGAFRRFKDVLVGYPAERERWFGKRASKLRVHMTEWLAAKHLEPTNNAPWETEQGHDDEGGDQADQEARTRRESTTDLRQVAHELVDLVPSRELPIAVAFLEFLRSRRGFRRSRFG
jgi:hypothetical protein